MARSNHDAPSDVHESSEDDLYHDSPPPQRANRPLTRNTISGSLSPSPAVSISSDKENRAARAQPNRESKGKGKMSSMAPPPEPSSKRRKLGPPSSSQAAHRLALIEAADSEFYDPDQDAEERRRVRKGLRDLTRDLTESGSEFLKPDSRGLTETIHRANDLFQEVKQTSDATLDSRLLLTTADLSYKRTAAMTLGDVDAGVDVDEFVSKCLTFMRSANAAGLAPHPSSSSQRHHQTQRPHRPVNLSDNEDAADLDDALDWSYLGRHAAFPSNHRPPVPAFLLGPLSLQKRARLPRTQHARLPRRDPNDLIHPAELRAEDLEQSSAANLTTLCTHIRETLIRVQADGEARVEAEAHEGMTEPELRALAKRHHVRDDGGVGFFHFVLNPLSFAQSVENLFYVSFLLREGSVAINQDAEGFPTLHASSRRSLADIKEQGVQKYQAVFNLDYAMWRDLIDAFDIEMGLIPHRDEEVLGEGRAWYG
ncbi:MAG: nuclear protein [Vezdaea acicularis]|nr:MAG: nuclear protein [Vezdaea acicularis]